VTWHALLKNVLSYIPFHAQQQKYQIKYCAFSISWDPDVNMEVSDEIVKKQIIKQKSNVLEK
jgi:hypothetical protein